MASSPGSKPESRSSTDLNTPPSLLESEAEDVEYGQLSPHRMPVLRLVADHLRPKPSSLQLQEMAYRMRPGTLDFLKCRGAYNFPHLNEDVIDSSLASLTTNVHLILTGNGKRLDDPSNPNFDEIALFGIVSNLDKVVRAQAQKIEQWHARVKAMKIRVQELDIIKASDQRIVDERMIHHVNCTLEEIPDIDIAFVTTYTSLMNVLRRQVPPIVEIKRFLKSVIEEGNSITEVEKIMSKYNRIHKVPPNSDALPLMFDNDIWVFMQQTRSGSPQPVHVPDWKHELRHYGMHNLHAGDKEISAFQRLLYELRMLQSLVEKLVVDAERKSDEAEKIHLVWLSWRQWAKQQGLELPARTEDTSMQ